jgi:hypothetical protein
MRAAGLYILLYQLHSHTDDRIICQNSSLQEAESVSALPCRFRELR